MILGALAVAVLVSQTAEPEDRISDHVQSNIRKALKASTSSALVTVTSTDGKKAVMHVDSVVTGNLPTELTVAARPFMKQDLEPGSQLLVFFRGKEAAPAPTGQYELVIDGKIREYTSDLYLQWTKFEGAKQPKVKPAAQAAKPVAEPAPAAEPTPAASAPVAAAPRT